MCCFMFTFASCRNDNVKFDVVEENPSLISMADGSNINNILFDDNGLKIYKDYDEMVNDFNSNGVIIGDESFYEKYCVDFFDKKSSHASAYVTNVTPGLLLIYSINFLCIRIP